MIIIQYNYKYRYENIIIALKTGVNIKTKIIFYTSLLLVIKSFVIVHSIFIGCKEINLRLKL